MSAKLDGIMSQDLWAFSCRVYSDDAVSSVCLALQDDFGLDVNCVLACVWYGWTGAGVLRGSQVSAMVSQSHMWGDSVVRPLRAVRRWLKPQAGDVAIGPFRDQVKALELDAERHLQTRIEGVLGAGDRNAMAFDGGGLGDQAERARNARANLLAYAEKTQGDRFGYVVSAKAAPDGESFQRTAVLFDRLLAAVFSQ